MPSAFYKRMREPGKANPNPVLVTPKWARITSRQVSDYVLCAECEDLLNKRGEQWVLSHCWRADGGFPLQTILRNTPPLESSADFVVYAGKLIAEVDVARLVYFGASILWRAAVHAWRIDDHRLKPISIGPYEEELRLFLLGREDFPQDAVIWVSVSSASQQQPSMYFPFGGRSGTHYRYRFAIPGILFHFFIGKLIAQDHRQMCTQRSTEGFIYIAKRTDEIIRKDMGALISKARPSRALQKGG